ncbi:MAG: hypothetical protein V3S69_00485 [Dehalococcoidales bacterium]
MAFNWIPGCKSECRDIWETTMMKSPSKWQSFRAWSSWWTAPEKEITPLPKDCFITEDQSTVHYQTHISELDLVQAKKWKFNWKFWGKKDAVHRPKE